MKTTLLAPALLLLVSILPARVGAQASAPTVASIKPDRAETGSPVTLAGTNLDQVTEVKFGDFVAVIRGKTGTVLTAVVPSMPAGTHRARVTNAAGSAQSVATLQVFQLPQPPGQPPPDGDPADYVTCPPPSPGGPPVPAPQFTSFSLANMSTLTIHGANLLGASVKFSGTANGIPGPVSPSTPPGAGQITVLIPPGAKTGPVCISSPRGVAKSSVFHRPSPEISTFSPKQGSAGASVRISGRYLAVVQSVKLNETNLPIQEKDDTHATVTIPDGATGGYLKVHALIGDGWSTENFHVVPCFPAPSVFPQSGSVGSGVLINGSCLGDSNTEVRFNGARATITRATSNSLSVTVPAGATSGAVSVSTAVGTGFSGAFEVTGSAPPTPPVVTPIVPKTIGH